MATIHEDIIDGAGSTYSLLGWTVNRVFVVSDLSGYGYAMAVEAVDALIAWGLNIGTEHPEISNAYVFEMNPDSISGMGNALRITVVYRQFDTNEVYNISGGVRSRLTTKDYAGNEMLVSYDFPGDYKSNLELTGLPDEQILEAQVLESSTPFTITRTERVTSNADISYTNGLTLTGAILVDRNIYWAGTVNSSTWSLLPGYSAKRFLCKGISASSDDGGLSWRVTYSFDYDKNEWVYSDSFRDPASGRPPPGATVTDFVMQREANFNLLGL